MKVEIPVHIQFNDVSSLDEAYSQLRALLTGATWATSDGWLQDGEDIDEEIVAAVIRGNRQRA